MIAVGDRTSSNGCKYNQIGFAAPVVDKSLLVAKRKMAIAVFLCVIFMVSCFLLSTTSYMVLKLFIRSYHLSTIVKF